MSGLTKLYMFHEIYQNSGGRNCNQIKKTNKKKQAPVIQKQDSAIHPISHYPVDKY